MKTAAKFANIFITAVLLLSLCGAMARAEIVSSEGHSYIASCNDNGFTLTSEYPTSRFVEAGSASRVIKGTEVFYLGASCDVSNNYFGSGTWCWANGGFFIDFDKGANIGFSRQELYCPRNDNLGMDCRCR